MLEIRVPQLGEGLREVRIIELKRAPGESIGRGDTLYVIETDKSTVELESPYDGRILEWRVAADDVVPVGATVAFIAEATAENAESRPVMAQRLIPPRTRAYAKVKGLSDAMLDEIPSASAKLLPSDVDAYLTRDAPPYAQDTGAREFKITGTHRKLIYRLRRSAAVVIPGTLAIDVPWSSLGVDQPGIDGTRPTPFQVFGHAIAQVAKDHPKFRSVMVGDDTLREHPHVNLGLAVARPHDELVTAVVREADRMTLSDFVRACTQQMRSAIRSGDQAAEDTQILLTHLGDFGIIDAIPTLVAPASSVFFLGIPVEKVGTVRVVMTFDHRLINGAAAAHFLESLSGFLRGS